VESNLSCFFVFRNLSRASCACLSLSRWNVRLSRSSRQCFVQNTSRDLPREKKIARTQSGFGMVLEDWHNAPEILQWLRYPATTSIIALNCSVHDCLICMFGMCMLAPSYRQRAKVAFFLWPWQVWYYIFRNSLDYADVGSSYDMVHSYGKNIIWNKHMWLQKDRFACRSCAHLAQFLTVWLTG